MLSLYKNAFGGLSKQVWLLSFVMLINRSGTMVIAFLSIYLTQKLGFGIEQAGIIMFCYGLGSLMGTYIGGKLSDKIGYFYVQFWSLLIGGLLFIILTNIRNFLPFCIISFFLSAFGEAYRPANTTSVADFSTEESFTRSISLIRLAINVGWAIGPAIGGFLAAKDYTLLFWADGITNIGAALLVFVFLRPKHALSSQKQEQSNYSDPSNSAFKDKKYIFFLIFSTFYAIAFFQLFTIGPLFYKEVCQLSETQIGFLLGLNGLLVALVEMVLVYKFESKYHQLNLITIGIFLVVINYIIFLFTHSFWGLVVAIVFATFSEILAMPFMNTFTIERSKAHNRGQYSGLYAMTWSFAQISSPLIGTQTIANFGFDTLWYILGSFGIIALVGMQKIKSMN